ncbi:MAG: TonB-dependent receptor [Bryobacteraceae bacterium]
MQVSTDQRMALDIPLDVGQAAESVTITADASMLETNSASVGQVITSRQIENMPMAGRTPLVLAQLSYGVIPTSDPKFYRPFDNAGPSDFSIGGTPGRSNDLLLDGAPNTTGNNRVAYNPPVDAVAEMKVETFPTDAAYGHSGGGTVNVVMRGGTNSFHGSLYEFNQVSRLAATPFFTNFAGLKKQVTRFNQYGGSIGGPVLAPKLFNGRDKLFFFLSYEGIKDSIPNPSTQTVPTAAERRGDFSDLLRLGPAYQIYDPATGVAEGGRIRRQPFPNNIIPTDRLNPIALNYLRFYPQPNQTGRSDGGANYLSNTDGEINQFIGYLGRMDVNFSSRHKLFMNGRHNDRLGSKGNFLGQSPLDATAILGLNRTNWGALIDDVYTFSPTLLLNTRVNWTRFEEPRPNFSAGFDMTTLGFPASLRAASPKETLPAVIIERFTGIGDSGGVELPFDSYQIFSTATKIAGRHTLKAGLDLRWMRESGIDFGYGSGSYVFGTNWTRGPFDNSTSAPLGQDFASFLLGMPTAGGFDRNSFRTNQAAYYAFFLQDDFRIKPNLTFNIGLRYERDLPTTERFNRSVNGFDPAIANPVSAAAGAAYNLAPIPEIPVGQFRAPGGLLFANNDNRHIYKTNAKYFDPRFGCLDSWIPGRQDGPSRRSWSLHISHKHHRRKPDWLQSEH